jgi:hypothetical protein
VTKDFLAGRRYFIGWREPGGSTRRKVELRAAHNINEEEPWMGRAVDHIVIPQGAIVEFIYEEDDETTWAQGGPR